MASPQVILDCGESMSSRLFIAVTENLFMEMTMVDNTQQIVVTDVQIPFWSMVVLMVMWAGTGDRVA